MRFMPGNRERIMIKILIRNTIYFHPCLERFLFFAPLVRLVVAILVKWNKRAPRFIIAAQPGIEKGLWMAHVSTK